MTSLINQAVELLDNAGFDYAICGGWAVDLFNGAVTRPHYDLDVSVYHQDRAGIIRYMLGLGWTVYEACGGGMVHKITDIAEQQMLKRNIFCVRAGNTHFHVADCGNDMFRCQIDHTEQTRLDYIEFLFNTRTEALFIYARNEGITRELSKAVLYLGGIPCLAPELVLLYKSTDISREGYQQDYETALAKMTPESKFWLKTALDRAFPTGHPWLAQLG